MPTGGHYGSMDITAFQPARIYNNQDRGKNQRITMMPARLRDFPIRQVKTGWAVAHKETMGWDTVCNTTG